MRFEIVEHDRNVLHIIGGHAGSDFEVVTSALIEGDRQILRGLHIDGRGPGTIGVTALRSLVRELGRTMNVRFVVVFGGVRTTGAHPGHIPRPIIIEVK